MVEERLIETRSGRRPPPWWRRAITSIRAWLAETSTGEGGDRGPIVESKRAQLDELTPWSSRFLASWAGAARSAARS